MKKPRCHQSLYGINGFLIAEIESPYGSLQIVSAHLDPLHLWTTRDKWSLPYQLLWGQSKIHRAEGQQIHAALDKKLPTILAGDFNSATPATIEQWKELGFIDSYAAVTPCSFQKDTLQFELLGINTGRRIDYILHDDSFRTTHSQILPGAPSDHRPVVSTLDWNQ